MKKKIMGLIAVVAIAVVAGYNIYTSQNNNVKLSDLALSNIEALANSGEGGVTIKCCAALWGSCKDDVKAPYVECTWNK